MPSLKKASASLTNEYVRTLFVEVDVKAQGADASIRDINQINRIRANVSMADEVIRRQLKRLPRSLVEPDPDKDCR